jgi:anthranilate phosphoribosyltransferase
MTIKKMGDDIMNGEYLSYANLKDFVSSIREGRVNDLEFVAILAAMETRNRLRGIDLDEVSDFVRALRVPKQIYLEGVLCPAGTGGDPVKTINVSTPASVILSSGNIPVLKNGFKSVTGMCGSRELLKSWGINPFQNLDQVIASVENIGIGYYDFQNLIVKERRSGFRSPLNYIGALSHPIQVDYKVLGCANENQFKIIEQLADRLYKNYLLSLNPEIDEISTVSPTVIVEKRNGEKTRYSFDPKNIGINQKSYNPLFALSSPQENADCIEEIFNGRISPRAELIALNSGAGFYLTGKTDSLRKGYEMALDLISSHSPAKKLQDWRDFSRREK